MVDNFNDGDELDCPEIRKAIAKPRIVLRFINRGIIFTRKEADKLLEGIT